MNSIAGMTIKRRKAVIIIFVAAALICAVLFFGVKTNYNMADYLPDDTESTRALQTMESEFDSAITNARVLIPNVTIQQALDYKARLDAIEGVSGVMWLDDVIDLKTPIETADPAIVENYYKDGAALISICVAEAYEVRAINEIRELVGEDGAVEGNSVVVAVAQEMSASEASRAVFFLVPLIIIILLLTTTSWLEPLLFLISIGVAVLLNMGSNAIFGEVSFLTFSVSPVLQMAVSLDYSIFLLHSFDTYRQQTDDIYEAMRLAIVRSCPSILASALTTLFGFLALVFMRFSIGADLGINLAKGILLSLVTTLFFLPALALCCHKLLDKTRHRPIIGHRAKGLGKVAFKLRVPALILVLLLIVPCYLAQSNNQFTYGMGALDLSSRAGRDEQKVVETFGQSQPLVLLVPKGELAREAEMAKELEALPHVTSVVSYVTSVGAEIPEEYVGEKVLKNFFSENYSRMILYIDTASEGTDAFSTVSGVRDIAKTYYGDKSLTLGSSANMYDIRNVTTADSVVINVLAIVAIGLVLLFTFKSISLPLILLLTIETSIWINLSYFYFNGSIICYIGFLIINTVQLGATVDYAILFTDHYRTNRRTSPPREAVMQTVDETVVSILMSAVILSGAGTIISLVSSNEIVSQLGSLLGKGAILSAFMVLLFLPAALTLLDGVVRKTTIGHKFLAKENKNEKVH